MGLGYTEENVSSSKCSGDIKGKALARVGKMLEIATDEAAFKKVLLFKEISLLFKVFSIKNNTWEYCGSSLDYQLLVNNKSVVFYMRH
jgi:hypothetical protein